MSRSILMSLSLLAASLAGCGGFNNVHSSDSPTVEVRSEALQPGGVYIAYMLGCERGCDRLAKGDLILEVDGQPVQAALPVSQVATGGPVRLKVHKGDSGRVIELDIVATPSDAVPPIRDAPPFWTVGAAELDRAPQWARRNLFGHVSPLTMLVNADGGIIDGRQLFGKKRLMLFLDYATREEQREAIDMLRVLQMAHDDLRAAGVDVMFVQLRFPTNGGREAPMNDTNLRWFQERYGQPGHEFLPMYRYPNEVEYNRARELGLEGATSYSQYLRQSPAIVLLDEDGIVRWHSEGIRDAPPNDKVFVGKDDQYTIIQAIEFAKQAL